MGTTLHNFIDIFNSNFEVSGESIQLNKIVIPIIQRDYAQGRTSYTVNRVRERFLNALKDAICNEPVTLDFVYGDIDENGQMTPLDGQQRLTTLFCFIIMLLKKSVLTVMNMIFSKTSVMKQDTVLVIFANSLSMNLILLSQSLYPKK